ncbi:hypothetical protein CVV65_05435 [Kyrpidia spormannii]|uniref:Uracil-DNA glycosylase-like domain-containing protein n=1 Tax=Kyrpidia spormannii TaxID=2055160 RepID=A0A2K8N563_9BACL|nr:hypothetical protein [Kyrpidia spormannii]ATY84466.1 hypothetical protein CVV65_05435 [Kyrpidia spormannii]
MSEFEVFEKERRMELALQATYNEWWRRMFRAVKSLDEQDIRKLSNPFVIKCLPAYRKARRKVFIVGKETNGWGSFYETLDHFRYADTDVQREEIIQYLQWMYEDFRLNRKWDHTPFWRGSRELFRAVAPDDGDDAFLNAQLIPFDYMNGRPPSNLEELLHSEFNVLPMTIEAIQPDVVLFLTGYAYDERIKKTFRNQRLLGDTLAFHPIDGFHQNQLVRLSHQVLPYHTYRTYHPGYSLLHRDTAFDPVKEKLKELVEV